MPNPKRLPAILLVLLLYLPGCGDGTILGPSGKSLLVNQIATESDGQIELASFAEGKTVESKILGMDLRETTFTATLEFQNSARWRKIPGDSKLEFKMVKLKPAKGFDWQRFGQEMENFGIDVSGGAKLKIEGSLHYKKEGGSWKYQGATGHVVQ